MLCLKTHFLILAGNALPGVTRQALVFMKCNGMTSFMDFMTNAHQNHLTWIPWNLSFRLNFIWWKKKTPNDDVAPQRQSFTFAFIFGVNWNSWDWRALFLWWPLRQAVYGKWHPNTNQTRTKWLGNCLCRLPWVLEKLPNRQTETTVMRTIKCTCGTGWKT